MARRALRGSRQSAGAKECEGYLFLLSSDIFLHLRTAFPQVVHNALRGFWCIMDGFFNALSVAAFILSILAALFSARLATLVQALREQLRAFPLSRLKSVETSQEEIAETVKQLANRVKMQRVRTAINHTNDEPTNPDPYTNPDAWRRAANKRIALPFNRGKS